MYRMLDSVGILPYITLPLYRPIGQCRYIPLHILGHIRDVMLSSTHLIYDACFILFFYPSTRRSVSPGVFQGFCFLMFPARWPMPFHLTLFCVLMPALPPSSIISLHPSPTRSLLQSLEISLYLSPSRRTQAIINLVCVF